MMQLRRALLFSVLFSCVVLRTSPSKDEAVDDETAVSDLTDTCLKLLLKNFDSPRQHIVDYSSFLTNHSIPDSSHYYWNHITGDTQWEDPGGVPHTDEDGNPYWLDENGQTKLYTDPDAMKYAWVEGYSEEHSRPFFYNQETKESVWSRPVDLAWQRVPVKDEL